MIPGMSGNGQFIVTVIVALLTSGFAKYVIDIFRERAKARREAPPPSPARQAEIDQSLLAMAKANGQLEDDNDRLRGSNKELDEMLRRERTERAVEREAYQREVRDLEQRLREMSREITELLRQVGQLRVRHDTGDIPVVGGGQSRAADQQTSRPYHPYDHSTGVTEIRED